MESLRSETNLIFRDEPVDDAFLKGSQSPSGLPTDRLNIYGPDEMAASGSATVYDQGTELAGEEARQVSFEEVRQSTSFGKWLINSVDRFHKGLMTGFVATHLNLAQLRWADERTAAADFNAVVRITQNLGHMLATVSPSLMKSRSELFVSSFFTPSGAYYTWLSMLEEEANEQR